MLLLFGSKIKIFIRGVPKYIFHVRFLNYFLFHDTLYSVQCTYMNETMILRFFILASVSFSFYLAHFLTFSFSLFLALSYFFSLSLCLSLSLSLSLALSLSVSLSLSLSLSVSFCLNYFYLLLSTFFSTLSFSILFFLLMTVANFFSSIWFNWSLNSYIYFYELLSYYLIIILTYYLIILSSYYLIILLSYFLIIILSYYLMIL